VGAIEPQGGRAVDSTRAGAGPLGDPAPRAPAQPALPGLDPGDERWTPRDVPREELLAAMVAGGMAGVVSHPMDNVLWKIGLLCDGDPVSQFGLSGVDSMSRAEVLRLVAEASGFEPDPFVRWGPVRVQAELILRACEAAGERLALAAERRQRVLLATGHPSGPVLLYAAVGRELERRGCELLTPREGFAWREDGHHREIAYRDRVAVSCNRLGPKHTHSAGPMELLLEEVTPDLVIADHGFAGAAIERGVDAVSVADVNDPALIVARAQGRTEHVVVMDDNVRREAYWPCFQAMVAALRA
jgi:Phosphatase